MMSRANMARMVCRVAEKHKTTRAVVMGRSHHPNLVAVRIEIARQLDALGIPMLEIGRQIGRHHATVMYYLGRTHTERAVMKDRPKQVRGHVLGRDTPTGHDRNADVLKMEKVL